ncbi:MAG: MmgE/PrpD family protein [Chloroflexota bacterium]
MGETERSLAQWIVETAVDDTASSVIERCRGACFDQVGVTLVGAVQPVGRQVHSLVRKMGGNPDASVIGGGFKTSAIQAALANGTAGHALDYDDLGIHSVGGRWWGYPTVVLLPTLLALGEPRGLSGRQILEAYIIGFEVACSLRRACTYDQTIRGFHSTAVFGTMGAAAAASRLLHLSVEETVTTLGIAASMVSGVLQNLGTMTKPVHAGRSAEGAVLAAFLAHHGFTSSEDFLEGNVGWAHSFLGAGAFSCQAFLQGLGDLLSIPDRLVYKKYPCCGGSHTILDALLGLLRDSDVHYDEVSSVEIDDIAPTSAMGCYAPRTGLEAKFSVRWTVAVALRDEKVVVEQFTDDAVCDSRYLEAMEKVTRLEMQESHSKPVIVTIRAKDGHMYSRSLPMEGLVGTSKTPWAEASLKNKFRENASHLLSAPQVEEALEVWWGLEELPDVRMALELVRVERK